MTAAPDPADADPADAAPPAAPAATTPPPLPPLPQARVQRSRWFGIVWAVPLAALLIVAFLGLRALADRGIDVVVTFETGAGAAVNDTKVIYQGIEAGRVVKIDINEDGRRVDMTLRLDRRSESALTTTAKFWLIGARPSLNDISSVKAALAGLAIGVAPGIGGEPTRRFTGLSEPPLVMPGTPGTYYVLGSNALGTARAGSPLYYRGQEVGKVTVVRFSAPGAFKLDIFVNAPYDKLVRPAAAFWVSSPLRVSLTDKGLDAALEHGTALFNGAIEIDLLGGPQAADPSPAGTEFPLYPTRREAETGPNGPEVPYAMHFRGVAGDLLTGAPVRLLGFNVGSVRSVQLHIDPDTGLPSCTVLAVLYPQKLRIAGPAMPSGQADADTWRKLTDAALNRLLAHGHRARLAQAPPLVGSRVVTLDPVPGAPAATLGAGQPRLIPSQDATGGIDEITGQVNQILAKLNGIPLEGISQQVRQLVERLNGLAGSPELAASVRHLNSTLAQVDRIVADVAPQVGPLVARLNSAADQVNGTVAAARNVLGGGAAGGAAQDASLPAAIQELSDAARSIRTLADYLGRHPEALLRGRGAEPAPEPRAEQKKDAR